MRADQERMKMEMELRISGAISDLRDRLSKERQSSDPLLELRMRDAMREQESMRSRYEDKGHDMRTMKRELDDLEDKQITEDGEIK